MESSRPKYTRSQVFLVLAEFFANVASYPYFAYLPLLLYEQGFTTGEATFIMMWMTAGILFAFVFGRISDRIAKRKPFYLGGLVFQTVLYGALFLGNSLVYYSIVNLLRGFSVAMRGPACNALFADIVETQMLHPNYKSTNGEIRGSQLSLLTTLVSTGWATGTIISGALIQVLGSGILMVFLVIMSTISVAFAIPVKDTTPHEGRVTIIPQESFERNEPKEITKNTESPASIGKINKILYVTFIVRHFGLIVFLQILVIMLSDAGIPTAVSGIVVALNPIGQILAMIVLGRLIDSPRVSEKLMIGIGYILSTMVLLCYTGGVFTRTLWFFIAGQVCLSFAWGCIHTGSNKYIINRTSIKDRAKYLGLKDSSLQGSKLVAYQFYAILWITLSYQDVLPFAFLLPLTAAILTLWL